MDKCFACEKSDRFYNDDYRNEHKSKTMKSSYGKVEIEISRIENQYWNFKSVKKARKDISDIDKKSSQCMQKV